jgi:predicted metal-dependent hydrolase
VSEVEPEFGPPALEVQVVRSSRRRRTVGARLQGDVVTVTIPSWMTATEEAHWVEVMRGRFARARSTERFDLAQRTAQLAARYGLPRPDVVRWSSDMTQRWGSCTPATRTIRLSDRIAAFPDWVVDYVIVHELAHLVELNHSPAFHALVDRYPKAERARGFLIAKSGDDDSVD